MKKLVILTTALSLTALIGCDSDKSKQSETESAVIEQPAVMPTVQSETVIDDSSAQQVNVTSPDITVQPANQGMTQTDPAPATGEGLNPAHGEPGHRCDIAVGAPLSSPPGKTTPDLAAPTINTTPPATSPVISPPTQTQTIQPAAPAGPTPPGMNPPHGQPGHDCAIAVGAPLKK